MAELDPRAEAIRYLSEDRWEAHRLLFRHRHPEESCAAHREIVRVIHSRQPRVNIEGFRGIGKSTFLEEGAVLRACFREFHNMVVVSASYMRAVDRLSAIKREFEINPFIGQEPLFGHLRGSVWQEGKIVLATEACIQAIGRGQSLAGLKHYDWRPDALLIDDLEDPEEVRTDPEREMTWKWVLETLLPSLADPATTWVRSLGTRRGVGSLPERLEKAGWPTVKYPIEFKDLETGKRTATWPGKFPLAKIDAMHEMYRGDEHTWAQEYLCQASSVSDRVFRREQFRYEPRVRTWEPVYCFIDPARTVGQKSASTGWAAWSWVNRRLVVWASDAPVLLPDEIVALVFDLNERFEPVWIEIEQDGLEQFLLQPIRQEQVRRGVAVPYRGRKAITATRGGGKLAFIRGLQPFFEAGEVVFAQPLPELENQFMSFPHGRIDAANALAYAPVTRPAAPIYNEFSVEHIVEDLAMMQGKPVFLAANATGSVTAAVLAQAFDGRLLILADWVMEGPPAECVEHIAEQAVLAGESARLEPGKPRSWEEMLKIAAPDRLVLRRRSPVWVVPPGHRERYTNVGLHQAVRAIPAESRSGGERVRGSLALRDFLTRRERGFPMVEISTEARWTLRALAGGYTRSLVHGRLQDEAEAGPYRVLIEGLESFIALVKAGVTEDKDEDDGQNWRVDERTGQRYVSAMPMRTQ